MGQILEKVHAKSKLVLNKVITNTGLFIFTHNRKSKKTIRVKNIFYGKYSLQKFDVIAPIGEGTLPVVFYFHGGGWSAGDKYGYTSFCQSLTEKKYIVCNVDYRLLPKVSVKDCINDCMLAIKFFAKKHKRILKDAGIRATPNFQNTYLVGDSAGAHLSSLIAGYLTTNHKKLPIHVSALGLYYGVFDFEHLDSDPSPIMQDLNKYWLIAEKKPRELYQKISSTNYVSKNFPPCFLTSGAVDKLHLQTETFVNVLMEHNVEYHYLNFKKSRKDAEHAFLNAKFLPSAKQAFKELTEFFEKYRIWKKMKK